MNNDLSTNIRLAQKEDLPALTEIYNQAIINGGCTADMDTFTVEERLPWFESHQNEMYPLYVYTIDEKIVAYVHLSGYRPGRRAMKHVAEVSYYVHSDYHGQHIGSALLSFAIEKARELGLKTILAILLGCNNKSIGLLEKYKFEKWGLLPDIADFDGKICSHLYYGLKI
jgi:phosphinothricin acetyltransferase